MGGWVRFIIGMHIYNKARCGLRCVTLAGASVTNRCEWEGLFGCGVVQVKGAGVRRSMLSVPRHQSSAATEFSGEVGYLLFVPACYLCNYMYTCTLYCTRQTMHAHILMPSSFSDGPPEVTLGGLVSAVIRTPKLHKNCAPTPCSTMQESLFVVHGQPQALSSWWQLPP